MPLETENSKTILNRSTDAGFYLVNGALLSGEC